MFYMNGDNGYDRDLAFAFDSLASVADSPGVNVVAQIDRKDRQFPWEDGWGHTIRVKASGRLRGVPFDDLVKHAEMDLGEKDMGDPATLRDFVQWSKRAFPARRTILVIWSHGTGFETMLLKTRQRLALARTGFSLTSAPFAPDDDVPIRSPVQASTEDESSRDRLFNHELADALRGLDVEGVVFHACLMAMVETAYELREVARFMIASEDDIPIGYWWHTRWLARLAMRPGIDPAQVGRVIVDDFQSAVGSYPIATLSAIDLTRMSALANAIDRLSLSLIADLPTRTQAIKAVRKRVPEYPSRTTNDDTTVVQNVDLQRFLELLSVSRPSPDTRAAARSVSAELGRAVTSRFATAASKRTHGSFGLAIYFPADIATYATDLTIGTAYMRGNTCHTVSFVENHRWTEFLHTYLGPRPSGRAQAPRGANCP
jgi:hypothetical protein